MAQIEIELANAIAEKTEEGEMDSPLLLGFVVVAEWMDVEGTRFLTKRSGSGQGEALPQWSVRGYLNEALNHWPEVDNDEEDENES